MITAINFYRNHVSRVKPPCCRFSPTCSAYAIEAIDRYGALKGTLLAVLRVMRCNPFCKGGYDPVK